MLILHSQIHLSVKFEKSRKLDHPALSVLHVWPFPQDGAFEVIRQEASLVVSMSGSSVCD